MLHCQSIFEDDSYRYVLDDSPCPLIGFVGLTLKILNTVKNSFLSVHEVPPKLRISLHENISTVYRQNRSSKNADRCRNFEGIIKRDWCKKHQEKVLSCLVLFIDWDAVNITDRLGFEHHLLKELEAVKTHLRVPLHNTKILLGLVCTKATKVSDPPPCGSYTSIEEAQISIRSRLGLSERSIAVVYGGGVDTNSARRLENMILENTAKYHNEEISRLKKHKNEAHADSRNSSAAAANSAMCSRSGIIISPESASTSLRQILVARNRFKIAWHATVLRDPKVTRRNLEKCYNALKTLPEPHTIDIWASATIVLWKMISFNLLSLTGSQRSSVKGDKDMYTSQDHTPKASATVIKEIDSNVQAFLDHLHSVVDHSFSVYTNMGHVSPTITPLSSSRSSGGSVQLLRDDQALEEIMRQLYMLDFYEIMARRLESMGAFLPTPADHSRFAATINSTVSLTACLPGYHYLCSTRILQSLLKTVQCRLKLLTVKGESNHRTFTAKPPSKPIFLGKEYAQPKEFYTSVLISLSPRQLSERIYENINRVISWYSRYNLNHYVITLMIDTAEHYLFLGNNMEAIRTVDRVLLDVPLSKWGQISLYLHEIRVRGSLEALKQIEDQASSESQLDGLMNRDFKAFKARPYSSKMEVLQKLIGSLLYLTVNTLTTAKADKWRDDLIQLHEKYPLDDIFGKAKAEGVNRKRHRTDLLLDQSSDQHFRILVHINSIADTSRYIPHYQKGTYIQRMSSRGSQYMLACPLFRVCAHFTDPFLESRRVVPTDQGVSSHPVGLTVTFESKSPTPIRLYDVEVILAKVGPPVGSCEQEEKRTQERRSRTLLTDFPVALLGESTSDGGYPSKFIELSEQSPTWSTTITSLDFMTNDIGEGLVEVSFVDATLFVLGSRVSSSRVLPETSNQYRRICPMSPLYNVFSSKEISAQKHASFRLRYDITSTISDEYLKLFEGYRFSTKESNIHTLNTSKGVSSLTPSDFLLGGGSDKKRTVVSPWISDSSSSDASLFNNIKSHRDSNAKMNHIDDHKHFENKIKSYTDLISLDSHRYLPSIGNHFINLHRPVIRITKPVPHMLLRETSESIAEHAIEGDDHMITLILESTHPFSGTKNSDTISGSNNRLLIPYISDMIDIIDITKVKPLTKEQIENKEAGESLDAEPTDVTGEDSVVPFTPIGYRMAQVNIKDSDVSFVANCPSTLIFRILFRCHYAGKFEIPVRFEYRTEKCAVMSLSTTIKISVCLPFSFSGTINAMVPFKGTGGEENIIQTLNTDGKYNENVSNFITSSTTGFSPLNKGDSSVDFTDIGVSEYMFLTFQEKQTLLPLQKMEKILNEKEKSTNGNKSSYTVHEGINRLLTTIREAQLAVSSNDTKISIGNHRLHPNNLLFNVESHISNSVSSHPPDIFSVQPNIPYQYRLKFTNVMRCPVIVKQVNVKLNIDVKLITSPENLALSNGVVVSPGEELLLTLHVVSVKTIKQNIAKCIGVVTVTLCRIYPSTVFQADGYDPLHGGGGTLSFSFRIPSVRLSDSSLVTSISRYPTTTTVGNPTEFIIDIQNKSAVPVENLKVSICQGSGFDRNFLPSGRTRWTNVSVGGFTTKSITLKLIPLVSGCLTTPTVEVISEYGETLHRPQDTRTIYVIPRESSSQ